MGRKQTERVSYFHLIIIFPAVT